MAAKHPPTPTKAPPAPPPPPVMPERVAAPGPPQQPPLLRTAAGANRGSLPAPIAQHELVEAEGTYRGEIGRDRRKQGQGTFFYSATGDVYAGAWEGGQQNGRGRFVWGGRAGGASFKGVFHAGQAVTRGTVRFAQETQVTHWFREGIAVQLVDPSSSAAAAADSSEESSSSSSVAAFRAHIAAWKQLQAALETPAPPVWSVQALVRAVDALAEAGAQPPVALAAAAAVPQTRGLVLTFADVEAGAFLTLGDALNKTCVLEKAVEHFCCGNGGSAVTADHLRMLLGASMPSSGTLDVGTLFAAIAELRDALGGHDVPAASRCALAAAAGEAVSLFRRPESSVAPAVMLAIRDAELFASKMISAATAPPAAVPEELAQLPGLYKERRAFEAALPRVVAAFEEGRKTLEPAIRTNAATAWCARAIIDIYIMLMADLITQRISRVSFARDLVSVFSQQPRQQQQLPRGTPSSSAWCWELVKIALLDLTEAAQAAKILPPLRDQKEPWDFWEIEQLTTEIQELGASLKSRLPKPGETPPPIPPRVVERKPLLRADPRALTPVGPPKCYCILKAGLIPLNKDLVGLINRGALSLLADLFNSCDNVIHTFAAKLLATLVLPWERQSEAVAGDLKEELVFSEKHTAELLGMIVWHSVNGTMNNTLRRDALHLLYRICNNNPKNTELMLRPQQQHAQPYLASMVPLLQGSLPVRTLALQIICSIASKEKYRQDVYAQIGAWPLHKILSEPPTEENADAGVLSAQTLGYLLSVPACLREARELGALARVIDVARAGRIMLHCQIMEEDLEMGPEIGRGAYASVHRAKWHGHPVAAKVFTENSMQFRLEDFLLEVAILSIVRHPNLMHMHGAVIRQSRESTGSVYIVVTELLESSLQRLLLQRKVGFPPATIHKYATDVAVALAYLHSLNMIHRDLKTANLLVDSAGTVKVCDFGLSRVVTDMSMTMCAGTPKWEAPECLESGNYTTNADVYSFAIVLWEMLTAQEPYNDIRTIFELKKQICDKKRRPDIPSSCPSWLRELMKACWHPIPKKRPTFEQIVERLAGCKASVQLSHIICCLRKQ